MSGGGTKTYKYIRVIWGGRMRSSLKLPKVSQGVPELLQKEEKPARMRRLLLFKNVFIFRQASSSRGDRCGAGAQHAH